MDLVFHVFWEFIVGGVPTWLSNSTILVFLVCWLYAPSSIGVSGSVYQVVGFNMVGKVVLLFSLVVEVPMSL